MVCFIHKKVISKTISHFYVFAYVVTVEGTLQKLHKCIKSMFAQGTCTHFCLPFKKISKPITINLSIVTQYCYNVMHPFLLFSIVSVEQKTVIVNILFYSSIKAHSISRFNSWIRCKVIDVSYMVFKSIHNRI